MSYILEFRKPIIVFKCKASLYCRGKHYAKGYCQYHYDKNCRGKYRYSLEEYRRLKKTEKISVEKKQPILNKLVRCKSSVLIRQKLKEKGISAFSYQDVVELMSWKYERVKKHILKLVKSGEILYQKRSIGGKKKNAYFIFENRY